MAIRVATLALVALGCSAEMQGITAFGRAQVWLTQHDAPDADQKGMEDLKGSDPSAFAIVQALLTKQSMGLMSQSSGVSHPSSALDILKSAPTIHTDAAAEPEVPVALSEQHVQQHASNPWSWKPKSADDDDALVNNVLGAVSELKSGDASAPTAGSSALDILKAAPQIETSPAAEVPVALPEQHSSNPWSFRPKSNDDDDNLVQSVLGKVAEMTGQTVTTPKSTGSLLSSSRSTVSSSPVQPAAVSGENPYLSGLNLRASAPAAQPKASLAKKNSWMAAVDFDKLSAVEGPKTRKQSSNKLEAFSWDGEDAYANADVRVQTQMLQKVDEGASKAMKKGSLSAWLRHSEEAEAEAPKPVEVKQTPVEEEQPQPAVVESNAHAMDDYLNWAHSH